MIQIPYKDKGHGHGRIQGSTLWMLEPGSEMRRLVYIVQGDIEY